MQGWSSVAAIRALHSSWLMTRSPCLQNFLGRPVRIDIAEARPERGRGQHPTQLQSELPHRWHAGTCLPAHNDVVNSPTLLHRDALCRSLLRCCTLAPLARLCCCVSTGVASNSGPLQVALAAVVVAAALLTAMGATGGAVLEATAAGEEASQTGEASATAMGNSAGSAATVTAASLTGGMATETGASVTGGERPAAQMYGRAATSSRDAARQDQGQACYQCLAGSRATVSWCLTEVLQGPTTIKLKGLAESGGSTEMCWSSHPGGGPSCQLQCDCCKDPALTHHPWACLPQLCPLPALQATWWWWRLPPAGV